jgi:hypothetical protein
MNRDDLASDAVYLALFRVVEIAELHGEKTAVEWAQSALEEEQLREGLVNRVRQGREARRPAANTPG